MDSKHPLGSCTRKEGKQRGNLQDLNKSTYTNCTFTVHKQQQWINYVYLRHSLCDIPSKVVLL